MMPTPGDVFTRPGRRCDLSSPWPRISSGSRFGKRGFSADANALAGPFRVVTGGLAASPRHRADAHGPTPDRPDEVLGSIGPSTPNVSARQPQVSGELYRPRWNWTSGERDPDD